ncbi:phospho-N-acetylmuramoyl-pentapeptide-transferase [Holzapfeliella sp. He02]|uniref:Phospho-N-acetylmuramoyl-pentapeptide-transferase n=1 Tax=Holzapfeliella saturejae TaxID=3082953 RepID=A0ABU8SG11_9LACO
MFNISVAFLIIITFLGICVTMPSYISYLRRHKEGQQIREEGPKWHEKKAGTPTMGGIVFLVITAIFSFVYLSLFHTVTSSFYVLLVILLVYGLIGFFDDFIKVFKKQNLGLKAYQKFGLQVLAAVISLIIATSNNILPDLQVPIVGTISSLIVLFAFYAIWIVGFSNAVNLSDGLDGLATGLSIIAFGTYGIIAYQQNNLSVFIFIVTLVASLLGFMVFNKKPAKIFMGDVGSLALGGILATVSILLDRPWSLLIVGIVFVLETLSVILQVSYFKMTHKRLFKMSPIHHHFEMLGMNEWQVDSLFWAVGLIASICYLIFGGI